MKIMFKVQGFYNDRIERHEVLRETESCVFLENEFRTIGEVRELKKRTWFDTWAQAHDFIVALAFYKVESCESRLQEATEKFAAINAMKEPL